jgi:hypothetical protein
MKHKDVNIDKHKDVNIDKRLMRCHKKKGKT